jgi:hypothetical protein
MIFCIYFYIYRKAIDMKFTKRTIVTNVLNEFYADPALNTSHMDNAFYAEYAQPFWTSMDELIAKLDSDEDLMNQWMQKMGVEVSNVYEFFSDRSMGEWIHQKITDEFIYQTMKHFGLNENNIDNFVEVELAYFISQLPLMN